MLNNPHQARHVSISADNRQARRVVHCRPARRLQHRVRWQFLPVAACSNVVVELHNRWGWLNTQFTLQSLSRYLKLIKRTSSIPGKMVEKHQLALTFFIERIQLYKLASIADSLFEICRSLIGLNEESYQAAEKRSQISSFFLAPLIHEAFDA